jgi:hypothetical protein
MTLVLMTALVGCGDSGGSERGAGEGSERRQKANFALAKQACEEVPKADFAVESVGIPADSGDRAIAKGYAAQWPRNDQKAALAGCLKGLEKAPARFPRSSPSARDIWGRSFLVTSITSNRGGDPPVVEPYRVRFWFSSERRHAVSWQARCNSTGADVRFTARRMETEMALTTAIGCPPGPGREDRWLERFMESNPEWRLSGENLRLVSNLATLELKAVGGGARRPPAE